MRTFFKKAHFCDILLDYNLIIKQNESIIWLEQFLSNRL